MSLASIASSLVNKYLADYVQDLDSDKMQTSVWSGEVSIQNLKVKESIGDTLKIPLKVLYSNIGSIVATVPWRDLGNSPVHVQVDDLFLIMSPKDKVDLEQLGANIFEQRQALLEALALEIEENIKTATENEGKTGEEGEGWMAGIINKIVNNIQIKITNIHIRIECDLPGQSFFAFGITLNLLEIYTVDESGERRFLDPSKAENKGKPTYKKMNMNQLSIYWNSFGKTFCDALAVNNPAEKLTK